MATTTTQGGQRVQKGCPQLPRPSSSGAVSTMKRSAENQLTKDSADDDDIQEISGPGGEFKKADDATLARRPIKALPKRGLPGSSTSTPPPSFGQPSTSMNGDKPQFGGFSGFGTNSSSTFTFNSSASSTSIGGGFSSTSTPPKFPISNSPFPGTSSSVGAMQTTPSSFFSSSNPPSTSSSSAASIFGSIVNNATKQNGMSPTPLQSSSKKDGNTNDDAAVKYYSSLRGLNVSLNAAVAKALEEDPFFDATTLLENYKSLKQAVEKEFDSHREKSATGPPNGSKGSTPLFGSTTTPPTLPVPPKGTTFTFGSSTPSNSSESVGFKPTGITPSFFSTPPSGKPSTPSLFGTPASSTAPKPFSFPTSTSDGAAKSDSTSSTSTPTGFSFATPKTSSIFGGASSSPFGASSVSTEKKAEGSAPSSTSFFGSTTSTPASSSTSIFGKGTLSNPAGFTFGSPTPEPEGPPTPGLSASGSSSALMDTAMAPSSAGDSRGVTPATTDGGDMDDTPKVLGANPNDEEGAGEEDEETTHTSRVKVYKMTQQDGKPTWAEYGIGMVRLKKHKETGAKRMLCRNSATAKIMINFRLYKLLKVTQTKQSISFLGHEDGKPVSLRLRLKDEASASTLKAAIDAEVAGLPT